MFLLNNCEEHTFQLFINPWFNIWMILYTTSTIHVCGIELLLQFTSHSRPRYWPLTSLSSLPIAQQCAVWENSVLTLPSPNSCRFLLFSVPYPPGPTPYIFQPHITGLLTSSPVSPSAPTTPSGPALPRDPWLPWAPCSPVLPTSPC